jgi:hypothetical protein
MVNQFSPTLSPSSADSAAIRALIFGAAARAGNAKGIEEFDSYERNFALEFACWSMIRATNHALQPREIRPNTRVRTKAVTGTVLEAGRGKSRCNERGLSTNESDPGFLSRHTRSRIP